MFSALFHGSTVTSNTTRRYAQLINSTINQLPTLIERENREAH